MNNTEFQIGKIEEGRFVIMRQFQSFAEFWMKRNGGLTVSYCLAYNDLDITNKIIVNLLINRFVEGDEAE